MKVHFICGYYSDLAHKKTKRPEDYWDARNYVWAVKTGEYKHKFLVHRPSGRVRMTGANITLARKWFGDFITYCLKQEEYPNDVCLVPVPSKDALPVAVTYRSLDMVRDAMKGQKQAYQILDAVRWTEQLAKAHEGGGRGRQFIKERLKLHADVKGRSIVLVDDLISTGSSMLAVKDVMEDGGAKVIGGVTCGKTVYDFTFKPFGTQHFDFDEEMHEYQPSET